jgi:DNA-binding beta-propeller fold protein YncE
MKIIATIITLIIFASCENRKQESAETNSDSTSVENERAPVTLKLKWETEPLLTTCESVLYDEDQDILYVANINGTPNEKDKNGFISKVSLDGKITEQQWVKGLDAPKGMGLNKGQLYVADIDRVHQIDTKTGRITRTYSVQGAKFLNDVSADNGKVYVSDSEGGAIYLIEDGKLTTWMEKLDGPNGLFNDGDEMLIALWNGKTLNTVDASSKQVTARTQGIENPDGIEAIGNNEYLVSSWNGMVHHIDSDWNKTLVLDTRQDSLNAADIEYVKSKNLLLVPTFFKNKVMAYEVDAE